MSVNDFIIRAVALALVDVPRANSQWNEASQEILPCPGVDISIAVATDKGLITPIVKDADKKSLTQISAEVWSWSLLYYFVGDEICWMYRRASPRTPNVLEDHRLPGCQEVGQEESGEEARLATPSNGS